MSTISSVGGASSAWSDLSSSRASAMKDRMFAKVDGDGSGSVDKTELQGLLDHIAEKSGSSVGSADDLLGKMDSDADGSLSKDELDAGMKSLMPAPSSTVDFAHQRSDGSAGPPAGGRPPPPPAASSSDSTGGSSSAGTDPLDTDGDGVVSAQEQAAGDLKALMNALVSAMDTDGDKSVSRSEADTFMSQLQSAVDSSTSVQDASSSTRDSSSSEDTSSGGQRNLDVAAFASLLVKTYSQAAANASQASTFSIAA